MLIVSTWDSSDDLFKISTKHLGRKRRASDKELKEAIKNTLQSCTMAIIFFFKGRINTLVLNSYGKNKIINVIGFLITR